jgi:hypothetical protein
MPTPSPGSEEWEQLSPAARDAIIYTDIFDNFDQGVWLETEFYVENEQLDEAIMNQALGAFDKASTYYSDDITKMLHIAQTLAARMQAMGCDGHRHFMDDISQRLGIPEALLAKSGKPGREDGHDHHDHDQETPGGHSKKRKRKPSAAKEPKRAALPIKTLFPALLNGSGSQAMKRQTLF